jgi:hypothetical protein
MRIAASAPAVGRAALYPRHTGASRYPGVTTAEPIALDSGLGRNDELSRSCPLRPPRPLRGAFMRRLEGEHDCACAVGGGSLNNEQETRCVLFRTSPPFQGGRTCVAASRREAQGNWLGRNSTAVSSHSRVGGCSALVRVDTAWSLNEATEDQIALGRNVA